MQSFSDFYKSEIKNLTDQLSGESLLSSAVPSTAEIYRKFKKQRREELKWLTSIGYAVQDLNSLRTDNTIEAVNKIWQTDDAIKRASQSFGVFTKSDIERMGDTLGVSSKSADYANKSFNSVLREGAVFEEFDRLNKMLNPLGDLNSIIFPRYEDFWIPDGLSTICRTSPKTDKQARIQREHKARDRADEKEIITPDQPDFEFLIRSIASNSGVSMPTSKDDESAFLEYIFCRLAKQAPKNEESCERLEEIDKPKCINQRRAEHIQSVIKELGLPVNDVPLGKKEGKIKYLCLSEAPRDLCFTESTFPKSWTWGSKNGLFSIERKNLWTPERYK